MGAARTPLLALAVVLLLAAAMTVGGHEHALTRLADDPTAERPHKSVVTPRTQQQLKFFKNHASDMADLLPSQGQQGGGSYDDDPSEPGSGRQGSKLGDGSNGGGQSRQAPATHSSTYLYCYQVGTPPQSVTGVLDISSELVWTQCDLCATCGGVTPATPFYDSTLSTTMAAVQCTSDTCQKFAAQNCSADVSRCGYNIYMYSRGGAGEANRPNTTRYLATESFTFGATRVDDVVFGCGHDSVGDLGGASGVIGLVRGPFSLVSHLGRFSYYLHPNDNSSGGDTPSYFCYERRIGI
ncbi:aspartic proteinase nepenthesin-2-like [Miscanthus floridulus]|uniref:aspartic proteinase nepenthesin-2-like n=1 Tax=Miscanthus floridulus TaxID=154761 RepID=UPI003458F360